MNTDLNTQFDLHDDISFFGLSEDEENDWEMDDLDLDLSDASSSKTVLD